MDLKPLPGKVLIVPDAVPTETESGLALVEHWPMEVSGVIAAIGDGVCPRCEQARPPDVRVGDRVLFGLNAGREVRINDTRYFLLAEADLLAVVSPETDVAA